jgi:hypothetical protein
MVAHPTSDTRFWSKAEVNKAEECWDWKAGTNKSGKGIYGKNQGSVLAHREAWELVNGPVPPGHDVKQSCENKLCVNPGHLYLKQHGDQKDKSTLVALVCEVCGSGFSVKNYRKNSARFCSPECKRSVAPVAARSAEERFWGKVNKTEDCWLWEGALCSKGKSDTGYGTFSIDADGTMQMTHRFSWELHNGPIPEGLRVLHTCDVKRCVRPDHLFLGTQKQNMEDKVAKGRHPKSLTPKQVLAIQEAYCGKPRPSQQQLAERFGVHQTTISNVIRGVGY